MQNKIILILCLLGMSSLAVAKSSQGRACESLVNLHASGLTITVAALVDAPATIAAALAQVKLATPFCRVGGYLSPTADSHIGFEVWMPARLAWNRKFQAVGNGGLSGAINYVAMIGGFNRGYATMTTDLGHTNTPVGAVEDGTWALGHPDKVVDYAYRGEHLSVGAAKRIIEAYYGSDPTHSYYTGCSAGGIQGMTELLRYPRDFDGYIIGHGTPDHLGQEIAALWDTLTASLADPANALQPAQMALVHRAVLRECAGKDGGLASDPFLTDPSACDFRAKTLQCTEGEDPSTCLNAAQIVSLDRIYQGPVNPRTHELILSGLTPGTELGWGRYFTGRKNPVGVDRPWAGFLTDMVYSDSEYLSRMKYLSFDFDKDYLFARKEKVGGESLDSSWNTRNRNLDSFKKRGGKVIHYHGWDDPNIPALEAVRFFMSIVADQSRRHRLTSQQALEVTQQFYRLFMVPGMGHCSGGDGPSVFGQNGQSALKADAEYDTMIALENWVEKGKAPEQFIASRIDSKTNAVDMTRPVCAYPKVPVWSGSGNSVEANSFSCGNGPRAALFKNSAGMQ